MSKNKKCPCQSQKCHLGIHSIKTRPAEVSPTMAKVQKRFFMGHGIVTKDPKEAARIFLSRDHDKIEALLVHYRHGQLGVYMVPPMFFGQVPEAVILADYKVPKHLDRVRGVGRAGSGRTGGRNSPGICSDDPYTRSAAEHSGSSLQAVRIPRSTRGSSSIHRG